MTHDKHSVYFLRGGYVIASVRNLDVRPVVGLYAMAIAYPSRCYGILFARFASCLELTDSNAPEILFDMALTIEEADRLSTTQVKASGLTKTCRTLHEHDE